MAHIICITTGLTGILHASFEVVTRLEAAGHRVTYACPQDVGVQVRAQGFTYVQLPAVVFEPAPALPAFSGALAPIRRMWAKIATAQKRRKAAIEALGMDEFERFLKEYAPDLLLLDDELHDHIITAVAREVPVALLSQWFASREHPGLPPISSNIVPGRGWRGQPFALKVRWKWTKLRLWQDIQKEKFFSLYTDRRSVLRAYAKSIGFPMHLLESYSWPPPFTYDHLPILRMTAWGLEFPHTPPPATTYVGPMVFAERKDTKGDLKIGAAIDQLLAEKRAAGRPLIYCSVSTMNAGDEAFLQRLIQAVAGNPDWMMILGLGGLLESDFLKTLPSNVYAFAWVPQLQVLKAADCSINHGGIHTINECIHFRVPMLIYSGKKFDQNGNAARVAYHQVGIAADKDTDEVAMIRQGITQLLTDPSFREKMDGLHEQYQANKPIFAQTVEHLLGVGRSFK
ncbi:MAG: glycosyltransferase [Saprospiraceae bacterium]